MKITLFLFIFLFSFCHSENSYVKIFQFDYSNISIMKQEIVALFDSIDYYINLLIKKKEIKDYNYYNKMLRDLSKNTIKCRDKSIIYNEISLIQKDISFLIIPKLSRTSKPANISFKTSLCKDEYNIPRVIIINLQYYFEADLEKSFKNEISKNYLFNRLIQIIFSNSLLDFHNLKRNKLISSFPEKKYLYFASYKKFIELTNNKNNSYLEYFLNLGNSSYWPEMTNFNDVLVKEYSENDSLKNSFTEITLSLLSEYPYEISHCDLFFYRKKKCFRVDQKCIDDCSSEKYFTEYYIDAKNKKIICNLKSGKDLINQKCGKLFGNVFYKDLFEPKNLKEFTESKEMQKLLLLKPSNKCPKNHPRTIFFEYTDYYRDDPYYYIKNKINVEYLELKDSQFFVFGKIDKEKSYMTKYRCFLSNNIFMNNLENLNYNIYWDFYPNLNNDRGIFFNLNKYQLIGKFPDESFNNYNNYLFYNKLKNKYPKDFTYLLETFIWPEQKDMINKKFNKYKYNSNNIWILKQENDLNVNNRTKYKIPQFFKSYKELEMNNENLFLTRYLSNPMLINNKKFSMKSFVLVTGFLPLKIYFYRDGYLTFAKNNFTLNEDSLDNPCIHISTEKDKFNCELKNKKNEFYEKSLFDEKFFIWNYLNFERYSKKKEINYYNIINQIKDIIIKTFISFSSDIIDKLKKSTIKDRNRFQLFTFDFILDENFKVYLIDFDKNPYLDSLHLVPIYIYDHLISDILNIVGVVPFSHFKEEEAFDKNINEYKNEIIENVEDSLCEFTRPKGAFELLFPLKSNIEKYSKYFEQINEENQLLWEKILKT